MKYTQKELFAFMEAGRQVEVTATDGKQYKGMCWAYSSGTNAEEFGVDEPSVEVSGTLLFASEIATIRYID